MTTPPRGSSPIATAMAILRCFRPGRPVLGVVEIAEEIGLHKSSVSRMMGTLEAENLVEQDALSKKYRLGLGLLSVTGSLLAHLDVRRAALPVLTALSASIGETSSLVLWDGQGAVTVEQVPSAHPVKHSAELGTRYETAENSSVRIFLAALTPVTRAEFLARFPGSAERYEWLSRLDRDGTCVNLGDTMPDEVGIATGVHDHRGDVIAAILISAPRYRVDTEQLTSLQDASRAAAADLTRSLGGAAPHS
ncbi:IclR family transcriptional regulator [Allobranchiibius sp. CTAmp26]|uniref:IclR family transcriptional regulator n=1 Tax=Allobranchiibius sp. CTAmp26 TaxID=2815214 RepID=UPI001AA0B25E|nr:IclR family transcriptional regulator [Allobranchiibius sp. CTAmp26]MBO1754563.1 IclR family transcriptional regulator [Allobranchiibius sp. CTAmp26]